MENIKRNSHHLLGLKLNSNFFFRIKIKGSLINTEFGSNSILIVKIY
jgi:hypothetical protein